MEWIISILAVSAFWYGWDEGERQEKDNGPHSSVNNSSFTNSNINVSVGAIPSVWVMWPVFVLGRKLGKRYMARQLAPERMRQKLLQEQQPLWPASPQPITWPSTAGPVGYVPTTTSPGTGTTWP